MKKLFDLPGLSFVKNRRRKLQAQSGQIELLQSRTVPAAVNATTIIVEATTVEESSDAQAEAFYAATSDCEAGYEEEHFDVGVDAGTEADAEEGSVRYYSFMARGGEKSDSGDESREVIADEIPVEEPQIFYMTLGGVDEVPAVTEEFESVVLSSEDEVRFKGEVVDEGDIALEVTTDESTPVVFDLSWAYRGADVAEDEVVEFEIEQVSHDDVAVDDVPVDEFFDPAVCYMVEDTLGEAATSDFEISVLEVDPAVAAEESGIIDDFSVSDESKADAEADGKVVDDGTADPVIYYFSLSNVADEVVETTSDDAGGEVIVSATSDETPSDDATVYVRSTSSDLVLTDDDDVLLENSQVASGASNGDSGSAAADSSNTTGDADSGATDLISQAEEALPSETDTLVVDASVVTRV